MMWRVALFFAAVFAVAALTSVYVVRRANEIAPIGPRARRIAIWTLLLSSGLPLVRFLGPQADWVATLSAAGFFVALALVLSAAALVLVDAVSWLVARRARGHVEARVPEAAAPEAPVPEAPLSAAMVAPAIPRREALRRIAVGASIASGVGTSAYGLALGRHDYVLEDVPIRLARLPRTLDGYVIAQLSDLHLGTFVGRREIDAARALVRSARADLVVLTGDLVDHDPRYLPQLGALVRAMTEAGARDGVAAILGNHDDYTGADDVTATLRAGGVRVLRNASTTIGDAGGRFALLGVDDVWAPRNGFGPGPDLDAALAGLEPEQAKVLLCHNPGTFFTFAPHVDLQLSGHTHGGQVNPIVHPASWVLRYVAGRYVDGDAQLYVNRGFGTAGPPMRVGSAPELTRITLVAG